MCLSVWNFFVFVKSFKFVWKQTNSLRIKCPCVVHVSNILKCFISMHYLAGLNFIKVGGSFARRCNTLNLHGHSLVPRDMIKQALYLMGKFFVILLFLYGVCRLVLDNYVGVEEFKTLSIFIWSRNCHEKPEK